MKTVYFDHNVLALDNDWPQMRQLFQSHTNLRPALSHWDLAEIANGNDKQQMLSRAAFLDNLNPIWLVERLDVQNQEVKSFLWAVYYRLQAVPVQAHTDHLSVILSYILGPSVPIGITAQKAIGDLAKTINVINNQKKQTVSAISQRQAAGVNVRNAAEKAIFYSWVIGKIPLQEPSGKLLTQMQKDQLVEYCFQNQQAFYAACPAMHVEHLLTEIRASDPARKPKETDAIDLQHLVQALAYCDYFVSRDGYAATCAEQVVKQGFKTKIFRDYASFSAAV